ncbi:MAG: polymorphic toxin type 23 domain-containing protein [Candidatus Azobacteroides sp.]|nr:polymorphic toxin type 23 domain-containing protein [Candidatus Azobacteroides sp.]
MQVRLLCWENRHDFFWKKVYRYAVLLILFFGSGKGYAQYRLDYSPRHLSTLRVGADREKGFNVLFSLTALWTMGSIVEDGLRWGVGLTLSQTLSNWTFAVGADCYKEKRTFGFGNTFAGLKFEKEQKGFSYYLTQYHQRDAQRSGIIRIRLKNVLICFEDDILAYPLTGFKIQDRYRTSALEIRYKEYLIGTNVYTTDIDGLTDFSPMNVKGVYKNGRQLSSPVYVGYADRDLILRIGINDKAGGWIGQNGWHRFLFQTPDFVQGDYRRFFLQTGIDKSYTLF